VSSLEDLMALDARARESAVAIAGQWAR
jgi:1-deoxy-D-xylulose-5-phosphate reductoisomerase